MIEWLEKAIDFSNILNSSITASWLILVVIGLRLVLKKAPKWVNVALWGIVALRLLMPFSIESSLSLVPSVETVSEQLLQAEPEYSHGEAQLDIITNPNYGSFVSMDLDVSMDSVQWSMVKMSLVWYAGIAVLSIYTAVSYLILRRKLRTAVILKDNQFQCETVNSPFVLGILKPKIYLPYTMDDQNLKNVIAHEQAHIRRKDHWWKPLGFLLLIIHWFNPLMWIAYILLCRDIELACDEKVIAELGNEQRANYTEALVSCAVNRRTIAVCPLAFGEVGVKERVKSIMNYKKPAFSATLISVIMLVFAVLCFLTNPEKYNPDKVYPQAVLQEPDRILIDVSGTDSVYERDSVVYQRLVDTLRKNWWKYSEENTDTAQDSELVQPIAPELLKTTSWRTYVENSDTIICFQYTQNPIIWENADGGQTAIETIAFVLPEKTWSEDNTKGFFAVSKTEQYGYNEGIYTYYYPPEIANDFWGFVKNAKLSK